MAVGDFSAARSQGGDRAVGSPAHLPPPAGRPQGGCETEAVGGRGPVHYPGSPLESLQNRILGEGPRVSLGVVYDPGICCGLVGP